VGWTGVISIIFGVLCALVLCCPKNLGIRKAIVICYWINIAFFIIAIIWNVIVIATFETFYDCGDFSQYGNLED